MENSLMILFQAANGSTFNELRSGLNLINGKVSTANEFYQHYEVLQKGIGKSTWSMSNRIYIPQGQQVRKEFQDTAVYFFKSGITSVNFGNPTETTQVINSYVDEKTHGMIKNIFKSEMISLDTQAVLVNAAYFNGIWETRFNTQETKKGEFFIGESETVPVDFMHTKTEFNYAVLDDLHASAIEINYANSNLTFLAILPLSRTGLPDLIRQLYVYKNYYDVYQISNRLQRQVVDVTLPKFKIDFTLSANDVLKNVNMNNEKSSKLLFIEFF